MSRRNPTGREWLRELPKAARQMKRTDPLGYESLMWMRDLVLDAAAAGSIDLAQIFGPKGVRIGQFVREDRAAEQRIQAFHECAERHAHAVLPDLEQPPLFNRQGAPALCFGVAKGLVAGELVRRLTRRSHLVGHHVVLSVMD